MRGMLAHAIASVKGRVRSASTATAQRAARILEADFAPVSLLDPEVGERLNLEIHQIEALQSFTAGPFRVTALPANHDPTVDPLLYAIEAVR